MCLGRFFSRFTDKNWGCGDRHNPIQHFQWTLTRLELVKLIFQRF